MQIASRLAPAPLPWLFQLALCVWLAGHCRAQGPDTPKAPKAPSGGNRLTYLDKFCDPYYAGPNFPKLTTPQWVGDPEVEAVVTLGIDDMRDPAKYEQYLRPLLERLKAIDGRAPVSIMTCNVDPQDPQLQAWLQEGLSLETHTVDHPCPCLQGGDFQKAKSTYDRCVDMMFSVPNSHPVAFRFPCMDSKNTPSPRAFAEIINQTTPQGNFLQASTSVTCLFTSDDPQLPNSLTLNDDGSERFRRYIPFPSFVNKIENYPYPFVIGKKCWEFPCTIPDDWQAQNIQRPHNPRTVTDLVAALEATYRKQGMANVIFHPHGWIRAEQMAAAVDAMDKRHGKKILFLNFRECVSRLTKNMLLGQALRGPAGGDNGVRLLDLNDDGYLDVLVGNEHKQVQRVWSPADRQWQDQPLPFRITGPATGDAQERQDLGVRLGILDGSVVALAPDTSNISASSHTSVLFRFDGSRFVPTRTPPELARTATVRNGVDQGVRWRDVNGDGQCELIVANPSEQLFYQRDPAGNWQRRSFPQPLVDAQGRDFGARFVDLDSDGHDDLVVSNGSVSVVHLCLPDQWSFSAPVKGIKDSIPTIARAGKNGGVWFADNFMWVQNETTHRLPDGVDRRSFTQLLGDSDPPPRTPQESLNSMRVRPGLRIELVAAEPLVMDPIAVDWGPDGKLWVVEMADYPLGLDDRGKPGGRVRYLEDSDGDGRYDRSTLFLDNIPFPTGVMAWRDGVLVSAAPTVFYAEDTDDDGKADRRRELFRGFVEGNQQHRVNGFEWGLDNWVYLANGDSGGTVESIATGKRMNINGRDLRIRPDTGEMQALSGRTQFGRHRDSWGNWFGCSNPVPVRHYLLDDHYLSRNPHIAPPSTRRDIARVDNAQLFPISRVLSHWSGYKPPQPGEPHKFTSACSTSVYRDNWLGKEFQGNTFTCEPVHNAVHRRLLVPDGLSFRSERPADEQGREFLASSDSWFRPATVTTGPDGALWVVDMYRLVIEHPEWIDDQREKELFLRAGHTRGRIYRILPEGRSPREVELLGNKSPAWLAATLSSPNGRQRDLAQRLLVHRADPASREPLLQVLNSRRAATRLHVMCALAGLGELSLDTLLPLLDDPHPGVRRHAVRLCEPLLADTKTPLPEALWQAFERRVTDADPHPRLQLAYTLGFAGNAAQDGRVERAGSLLAALSVQSGADPYFRAAIFSSLNAHLLPAYYTGIAEAPAAYRDGVLQLAAKLGDRELSLKMADAALERLLSTLRDDAVKADELLAAHESLRRLPANSLAQDRQSQLQAASARLQIIVNEPTALATRVAAVQLGGTLRRLGAASPTASLLALVDSRQPIELQLAAVEVAGAQLAADTDAGRALLVRLHQLSPRVAGALLDQTLANSAWTRLLFELLESNQIAPQLISASRRAALRQHSDKAMRALAEKWFGNEAKTDRSQLVEQYLAAMPAQGSHQRGASLFKKHCSACHRVGETGHAVGPDLTALKNRSLSAMTVAVMDPNRAVEDKYQSFTVLTEEGRQVTGIVTEETGASITLRMQEGKTKTILRTNMQRMQNSRKSLMPVGLEKELAPEQLRHLLAYVEQLNEQRAGPAKQFAGNAPKLVAGEGPTLRLSAANCRIYGPSLVFESKHKNLGFWGDARDVARWTVSPPSAGVYEVTIEYACPADTAGNRYEVVIGGQRLEARVKGGGGWDDYRVLKLGSIRLSAGEHPAHVQAVGKLSGYLFDLRAVQLTRQ